MGQEGAVISGLPLGGNRIMKKYYIALAILVGSFILIVIFMLTGYFNSCVLYY
jgi:hypothetical protein